MQIVIANSREPAKPFLDRIHLHKGDVTRQDVDAIAMLIPRNFDVTCDLNHSIARASGTNLDEFILEHIYKPKLEDVYALPGFDLPCRHILLGIMPYFRTDFEREDYHLSGACRRIMELSRCMLLSRIAFPVLGLEYGYPKARAARLILRGITERINESFHEVHIVVPDDETLEIFSQKLEILGWRG